MNVWKKVYGVCFFALCLCPSVGMFWAKTDTTAENRALSEIPKIKSEEGWNLYWLSNLGDYFQEHFAYRPTLVTANALVHGKGFGVSTASGVVQGEDGWLYYSDSLSDYLGEDLLSERSLYNVAHTLKLMQENLNARGIRFLFTIAPNKNSLYSENMPYYHSLKLTEENNRMRLTPILLEEGVQYADLYAFFSSKDEILYHERDSHWNNKGAMLAGDVLLEALGKEHDSYEEVSFEIRNDFAGDLDKMLYPEALTLEDEIYYEKDMTYTYEGEIESTFDPKITTKNPGKEGSLVMYRDSFGNALLPFIADAYGDAYFSRGVPYQLNDVDVHEADTVLVERAERFLPDMAENPPVLAASRLQSDFLGTEAEEIEAANLQIVQQGMFWKITGTIPEEYMENNKNIFLLLDENGLYEAFPMDVREADAANNPYGFCLYVPIESLMGENSSAEVFLSSKSSTKEVFWVSGETEEIIEKNSAVEQEEILTNTETEFLIDAAPVG